MPSKPRSNSDNTRLRKVLGRKRGGNLETRAHTQGLLLSIDRALDVSA